MQGVLRADGRPATGGKWYPVSLAEEACKGGDHFDRRNLFDDLGIADTDAFGGPAAVQECRQCLAGGRRDADRFPVPADAILTDPARRSQGRACLPHRGSLFRALPAAAAGSAVQLVGRRAHPGGAAPTHQFRQPLLHKHLRRGVGKIHSGFLARRKGCGCGAAARHDQYPQAVATSGSSSIPAPEPLCRVQYVAVTPLCSPHGREARRRSIIRPQLPEPM